MAVKSVQELLKQIEHIYLIILDNHKKGLKITPETEAHLLTFLKKMNEIEAWSEKELMEMGFDPRKVNAVYYVQPSKDATPEIKELLLRSHELRKDLQGCYNVIQKQIYDMKRKTTTSKQRQKKFRGVGSDENWMPM